MDFRQIRTFLAVADTRSTTRAAELLHIVQSAVSRQLKLLEGEIGVPLFDRDRTGMQLTDAGRIFLEHARRALQEINQAQSEIRPVPGQVAGAICIGLLPSSCEIIVSEFLRLLHAHYPAVRATFSVGYTDHLTRWLETGEIDVALLYQPDPTPGIDIKNLVIEPLSLVASGAGDLREDAPVPLRELGRTPLILPGYPHRLRLLVERRCKAAGVTIATADEANTMAVQKVLIAEGYGRGIMPRVAARQELTTGAFCAAPIDDPAFARRIVLARPTTRGATPAVRNATDLLVASVRVCAATDDWREATWIGD
ncbi:LysR family transcriptional regulator [Paraburkholderia madseniana]|nr:LysR family transcriptional regulator [Paraburkholderia madseniana]